MLIPQNGELAGILDARDNIMSDQMTGLDTLATALITRVNELHRSGFAPGKVISSALISNTITKIGAGVVAGVQPELPADTYSVETRLNGGVWQFRIMDSSSSAVNVQLSDGSGYSDQWQNIPASTGIPVQYDTGRGLTITFGGDPALYTEASGVSGAGRARFYSPTRLFYRDQCNDNAC